MRNQFFNEQPQNARNMSKKISELETDEDKAFYACLANLPIILKFYFTFINKLEFSDFFSEIYLHVLNSIRKYDESKSLITTYTSNCIRLKAKKIFFKLKEEKEISFSQFIENKKFSDEDEDFDVYDFITKYTNEYQDFYYEEE